jgi:predicted adenine nucleotide alpha hydrolase (AANH) superfamily ATPase
MQRIGKFIHLPNDHRTNDLVRRNLAIDAVDELADEIALSYKNLQFRQWYCGVIYDFGFAKVNEWRVRANEGNYPARLFSKYVKDARKYGAKRKP